MSILNPTKALRSLRKTPIILEALLRDVTHERAVASTDGPDGWNVVFVVCHLRDFETVHTDRARMMLEQDEPAFPSIDHLELVRANHYDKQELRPVFEDYVAKRQIFIQLLENLSEEQWARRAMHPELGAVNVLSNAINAALHDVNHIEQIISTLDFSA